MNNERSLEEEESVLKRLNMKDLQIGIPTERGDKIWRPVFPPSRKGGGIA